MFFQNLYDNDYYHILMDTDNGLLGRRARNINQRLPVRLRVGSEQIRTNAPSERYETAMTEKPKLAADSASSANLKGALTRACDRKLPEKPDLRNSSSRPCGKTLTISRYIAARIRNSERRHIDRVDTK